MSALKWKERMTTWKRWSCGGRSEAPGDPEVLQEALFLACLKKLWPKGSEERSSNRHFRDDVDQAASPWAHGLF